MISLLRSITLHVLPRLAICLAGGCLILSCITAKQINYLQSPSLGVSAYKDSVGYSEYKLQAGDRLNISIHSLNEETAKLFQTNDNADGTAGNELHDLFSYKINENGYLNFPFINNIHAEGRTVRDVKYSLEDSLKMHFGNCYARVNLVNAYFSVIGEGGTGKFALIKEKLNIFEALAIAGDLGIYANRKQIKILRQTQTGTIIKTFDIRSKDILHSEFYYVQPNDVIYIQRIPSHFFGVTSWTSLLGTITTTISLFLLGISISQYF